MATANFDLWKNLNELFETAPIDRLVLSIKAIAEKAEDKAELCKSAKTMADLNANKSNEGQRKKSWAYLLLSGLCSLELKRFAAATSVLENLKKIGAPKQCTEYLSDLISKSFSTPDARLDTTQPSAGNKFESADDYGMFARTPPLFSHLPPFAAKTLLDKARTKKIKAGEILFKEGDEANAFFIVAEGVMELSTKSGMQKEFNEGDFFGEIALLGNRKRTATLKAKTDIELLQFSKEDLIQAFIELPMLEEKVLQFYFWRLFSHVARQHPLFKDQSEDRLSHFFYTQKGHKAAAQTTLIQEGQKASRLFFLLHGEVAVKQEGKEIAKLSAGEFFGEIGLIKSTLRTAEVVTLTPCDYLECPIYLFASLCTQFPQVQKWLERDAEKRLKAKLEIHD